MRVCVCERERERESVCMHMCNVCVYVCKVGGGGCYLLVPNLCLAILCVFWCHLVVLHY